MNLRRLVVQSALLVSCVAVGLAIGYGSVRADGIPTSDPLLYTGYLTQTGETLEGVHAISVRLWDSASGGTMLCGTTDNAAQVAQGYFRMALDSSCRDAIAAEGDTWVEVEVDGVKLARSKVGAVPYAVEAHRATTASGASGGLAAQLATLQSLGQDVATLKTDVAALQQGNLHVFYKGGDNGTASCDAYCAGTQWGQDGTCVGARNMTTGAYVECAVTVPNVEGLDCWCSRPTK